MISNKEAILIKKFFGVGFSEKIAKKLKEKKITNRNGKCFQAFSVSDVLNGKNHSVLEEQIIKIWENEIQTREEEKDSRISRTKALLQ